MNLENIIKPNQYIETGTILERMREKSQHIIILPSGTINLDKLLDGGFKSKRVYLIFGANSTGKTQLCHQLCIEAYKKFSSSIYIDTENTFRPERIQELGKAQKLESDEILKSILVSKIRSNSMFLLNLQKLETLLKSQNLQVILIDSINKFFRLERANQNNSHFKAKFLFLEILENLNHLTNKYNTIMVVTAQISPSFINKSILKEIPVGIQYISHFFSEFIYLYQEEHSTRVAHLVNSFYLPEKKVKYKISAQGIVAN